MQEDLLTWRIEQLEIVERNLRKEVYEIRQEIREHLVKHKQIENQQDIQRQWPVIWGGVIVTLCTVTNLIITVINTHG